MGTKGESIGRQLDVYARRDPQLAPYLLRQVDTEFQRGCRKVKYIFWVALFVACLLYDIRVEAELGHFLQPYFEKLDQLRACEVADYEDRQAHARKLLDLLERFKNDPAALRQLKAEVGKLRKEVEG